MATEAEYNRRFVRRLINQAEVQLPGVSQAGLLAELFDVLREFFFYSSSWSELITVPVVPTTQDYKIYPVEGGIIIRLAGVYDTNNIPQPALMSTIGTIHFQNPFQNVQPLTAVVIKSVDLTECGAWDQNATETEGMLPYVPDWTYNVWGSQILSGVLGRFMLQVEKTWSDPQMAKFHLQKFMAGVNQARASALRNNAFGTQNWRFPQTFRVRTQRGGISAGNPNMFS